jgi:putative toxin-antitoxin system antitoxin component (TIGR02293 family)
MSKGNSLSWSIEMDSIAKLTSFMGGCLVLGSPKSDFDLIGIIRKGFPSQVIACVVKSSAIHEDVICKALRIAKRTAARRKATSSRLKPAESELIYRFSKVLVTAAEILGDRDKATEWFLSENRALNGNRPIDLLDTAIGYEDVINVLHRIEYGVYS